MWGKGRVLVFGCYFPVAAISAADVFYVWHFGDVAFDGFCIFT